MFIVPTIFCACDLQDTRGEIHLKKERHGTNSGEFVAYVGISKYAQIKEHTTLW